MELLHKNGLKDIVMCDIGGILHPCRTDLNPAARRAADMTNPRRLSGDLSDALKGAHIFIGVSAPDLLNESMIRSMAPEPFIFALANPRPEVMPDIALAAGAAVVGTGRSDFPNQINNLLAFPGIFRGALNARAADINDTMKAAAAQALADLVTPARLSPVCILPSPLDPAVTPAVAAAVEKAAAESNAAGIIVPAGKRGREMFPLNSK